MKHITTLGLGLIFIAICCTRPSSDLDSYKRYIKKQIKIVDNKSFKDIYLQKYTRVNNGDDSAFNELINFEFNFPVLFFPDTLKNRSAIDSFHNRVFSYYLYGFEELPYLLSDSSYERFRFTYLRSFNNPVIIEIKHKDKVILSAKISDGEGGYYIGKIRKTIIKTLPDSVFQNFEDKLKLFDFWNMYYNEKYKIYDGSAWILEGQINNNYHLVFGRNLYESHKIDSCCLYLLNFIKNDIDTTGKPEIY